MNMEAISLYIEMAARIVGILMLIGIIFRHQKTRKQPSNFELLILIILLFF